MIESCVDTYLKYHSKRNISWTLSSSHFVYEGVKGGGCRVHTHVFNIDEVYLHDDSPNNPNATKNKRHDLLVPLHFSFILCCLLSEELERVK